MVLARMTNEGANLARIELEMYNKNWMTDSR
jgi:hypothetical protein